MRLLDLFAGIGGFSLAAHWMGWETVAFVERDGYAQKVLAKNFPGIPIYDDVRTFNGNGFTADIVCGGFPCQDISTAGKQAGITGERSGLWTELHRIIGEIRPRFAVVENVAALLHNGMGVVLGDLSEIGYDAEWRVFSACELGFPHARERVFIVAYPHSESGPLRILDRYCREVAGRNETSEKWGTDWFKSEMVSSPDSLVHAWVEQFSQSPLVRVDDGIPEGLHRLRCAGNSIVPQIAFEIFRAIEEAEIEMPERSGKDRPGLT